MTFCKCQKVKEVLSERKMKKNNDVGIIKDIDKLGRIVIPKEYRERYALSEAAEIIATEDGVLVRSPLYKLVAVSNVNAEIESCKENL